MKMTVFVEETVGAAKELCDDFVRSNSLTNIKTIDVGEITEFTFSKLSSQIGHAAGSPGSFTVTDKSDGRMGVVVLLHS